MLYVISVPTAGAKNSFEDRVVIANTIIFWLFMYKKFNLFSIFQFIGHVKSGRHIYPPLKDYFEKTYNKLFFKGNNLSFIEDQI